MKAIIFGNEFKSCIDRISATIEKSRLPFMNAVEIVCNGKEAKVSAINQNTLTTVKIFADVIDAGSCVVDFDVLKKVCNVTGDVIVEESNGKFSVHSQKKHYEVDVMDCAEDISSFKETFSEDKHHVLTYPDHDLLKQISALDCMRGKDYNTLMRGFNIDVAAKRISTIDGHRVGIGYIPEEYAIGSGNFTVQSNFYKILKSVLRGTNNNTMNIYTGEKVSYFSGEDYEIYMRNIDGVWFDIDRIAKPMSYTEFSFKVNSNELGKIAKEYASSAGSDKDTPMLIYATEKNLVTAFIRDGYKTADIVEEYDSLGNVLPNDGWHRGLRPTYIKDACNIFSGEVKISGNFDCRTPITIVDPNGEYLVLILPVNMSSKTSDSLIDYARGVLA